MRLSLESRYLEERDALSREWFITLQREGIKPYPIPNIVDSPEFYLDEIKPDALILSGGDTPGKDIPRDSTETALLAGAIKRNLPVFGVCRGIQLINTFFGGTLSKVEGHIGTPHKIDIRPHWHNIYGKRTMVNSFHRDAISVDDLANGLEIGATDNDGLIEGLYHPKHPIAAVMWHPEREHAIPEDLDLLRSLIGEKK
jgi:putative glutamine amidotransferase